MQERIIIAGSRNFTNYTEAERNIDSILKKYSNVSEIISGKCRGADALGEEYARRHGICVREFPADWEKHGKAAGPVRNHEMAEYATNNAHGVLIAFWDGKSRGTASMIRIAEMHGMDIYRIYIGAGRQNA